MELNELEPRRVWEYFFRICGIPHPSHHEGALARFVADWARERGFKASIDESGNVILRREPRPDARKPKGIILQGHLDMVPQAAGGTDHDFLKDPIRPRFDPKDPAWLVASGTTLGADNGIGLAMALSALEDEDLSGVPMECLFTVNEEDGMSGARALKPGSLEGTILLNLDGEDDGELTIGSAGSIRTAGELSCPAERSGEGLAWFEASLGGLLGGHSGVDIDKGRANATRALARVLGRSGGEPWIAALEGGSAANAIPRSAGARIGLPADRVEAFKASFRREVEALGAELGPSDPGLDAELRPLEGRTPEYSLPAARSEELLALIASLPNGLVAMEPDMPGFIRTSLNLGRLSGRAEDGRFLLDTLVMIRSSSEAEKTELAGTLESGLLAAAGRGWEAKVSRLSDSPAWAPDASSPLLSLARTAYRELFGEDPKILSTHGGLETGIFRPQFPDWDMISMGPKILYPHSPDERLETASVERSYRFLKELILRAAR